MCPYCDDDPSSPSSAHAPYCSRLCKLLDARENANFARRPMVLTMPEPRSGSYHAQTADRPQPDPYRTTLRRPQSTAAARTGYSRLEFPPAPYGVPYCELRTAA